MLMVAGDQVIDVRRGACDVFTSHFDGFEMVKFAETKLFGHDVLVCDPLQLSFFDLNETKLSSHGEVSDAEVYDFLKHHSLTNLVDHLSIGLELFIDERFHVHNRSDIKILNPFPHILDAEEGAKFIFLWTCWHFQLLPQVLLIVLRIVTPIVELFLGLVELLLL